MALLRFLGYLDDIESDSQNVWAFIYMVVSGSVLPTLKS